jgi:adhesin/invasin
MGDNDCDNNVGTVGDGVVAAAIAGAGATAGARTFTATQGTTSQTADFTVVGGPNSLELITDETTVVSPGTTTCALTAAESAADIAHLHATVLDSAGTALTGVTVTFSSGAPTRVKVAAATVLSADNGTDNEALNVACGVTAKGDAIITASICLANCGLGTQVNASKTVTITAVGVPAKVDLKADPAQIACDGSASSTVTATVTDSDGKNVADGTAVTFSVVALGTANPINATTKAGVATSKITPLSVGVQGVTVVVSAGSVQSSLLVSCSLPVPTATAVGGAPGGGVTPPDTGSGGYLTQDGSAGFPLWTLVALALGSVALVAGGMVTRRAGR